MNTLPQQQQCKVVSDQQWSLGAFMEFYDRVLGPRIFEPYGDLLVKEIQKDLKPMQQQKAAAVRYDDDSTTAAPNPIIVIPDGGGDGSTAGDVVTPTSLASTPSSDSPARPISILEVACGTGVITAHLYKSFVKPSLPLLPKEPTSLDGDGGVPSNKAASDSFFDAPAGHQQPPAVRLVATDLSKITLDVAMDVLGQEVRDNVEFLADVDMAALPFEDDSFDILVCGFGLMFPPDKARVARELKRVLRPGGKIYGTVFESNELFDLIVRESEKQFGTPSAIMSAALSLTDPTPITKPLGMEGVGLDISLCAISVELPEAETREFLFNACILLEEFNQCDTLAREHYLDEMMAAFHAQTGPTRLNTYSVKAWLIRGDVTAECKSAVGAAVVVEREPDYSELVAFQQISADTILALACGGAGADQQAEFAEGTEPALSQFREAKAAFLHAHGTHYPDAKVELLRRNEYARLDANKIVYLDHVGGALAPTSLLEASNVFLRENVLGNPHSGAKASAAAYQRARESIFSFFNCTPDDYEIVFTPNASGAIRLVAECFPFEAGSQVLLSKDNHTSVHGLREYAKMKGGSVRYVTLDKSLCIHDTIMQRSLERLDPSHPNLLAFSAQSNATGAKQDLRWIRIAQDNGAMVLCDVAALVPQTRLDCSLHKPDFVSVSFYKIFGHPTGTGCLLARRASLQKLMPPAFSGGAVCYYSGPWSPTDRLLFRDGPQRFEIGTPNYGAYESIHLGFNFIKSVGIEQIAAQSCALARWLEKSLTALYHTAKHQTPLCRVYGPPTTSTSTTTDADGNTTTSISSDNGGRKGATVMLNFFDCYGAVISHALVRRAADKYGITVRNGCFCNLGAVQQATYATAGAEHCELDKKEKILDCGAFDSKILNKGDCGAVRVSFGPGSTFTDAYNFYLFGKGLLNVEASVVEKSMNPPATVGDGLQEQMSFLSFFGRGGRNGV